MKKLLVLLPGVALFVAACVPVAGPPPPPGPAVGYAAPVGVSVAVEDRPYYVRGPYYIENGRRWVWVPGHWGRREGRRVWIHGHYALRG